MKPMWRKDERIAMVISNTLKNHILKSGEGCFLTIGGIEYHNDSYFQHYKRVHTDLEEAIEVMEKVNADKHGHWRAILVLFNDCIAIYQTGDLRAKGIYNDRAVVE